MMVLEDDEVLDLQATLQAAIHALTYPVMLPGNAAIVERLQATYDAILSDDQRARRAAMIERLHAAREAGNLRERGGHPSLD